MTNNIGSTYVFGVFRTRSVHLTIYTLLRKESQPKMFCLITPQIKEEVICFLLYLRSLWNVVLDYDIKVEFWFRNGWLMTHMQTKNQSWWSLNPIFLSNIFVISTKVAPNVFTPKISQQLLPFTWHDTCATWGNRKSKNVKGVTKCNHINLIWQSRKLVVALLLRRQGVQGDLQKSHCPQDNPQWLDPFDKDSRKLQCSMFTGCQGQHQGI